MSKNTDPVGDNHARRQATRFYVSNWPYCLRAGVWIYGTLLAALVWIFWHDAGEEMMGWLDINCL